MFGKEWTSEYYELLEFYYWEPQHIGKIKHKNTAYANPKEALEHIRKMEVSLNHMFNIFFRLAPNKFITTLIAEVFNLNIDDKFYLQGRYDLAKYCQLVEPDLLFTSASTDFSIEMKLGAKSSLEQVYKYALLHFLEQNRSGVTKRSLLLFMGKGDFNNLWTKTYRKPREVVPAALALDIDNLKRKASGAEKIDIDWDGVEKVLTETTIAYCSYSQLASLLNTYKNAMPSGHECRETLDKLFDGLHFELARRKLV